MATASRTYKPTDWELWAVRANTGTFALDYSVLDGPDVLGGPSAASTLQLLPLSITNIFLEDGQAPDQGVFFTFSPGNMILNAQLLTWNDRTVNELANGLQVFLTLKNESAYSHSTFGKRTVYFIGEISSLEINVDPINEITNLTLTAVDIASSAVNVPVTISKSSGKAQIIDQAFSDAVSNGTISSYIDASLIQTLNTSWEFTGSYATTLGQLIDEFIEGEVAFQYNVYAQGYSPGTGVTVRRQIAGYTIEANGQDPDVPTIPESIISDIVISQDGNNVPTAFQLNNSTSTYSFAPTQAETKSNTSVYYADLDVQTANMTTIANKIREYTQRTLPTQVTIRTATVNQPIVFDDVGGVPSGFFYPANHYFNSEIVKIISSYTGKTTWHRIAATSHTITPDYWQTTYQLWKGL
jgi:hypothetical protein